MKKIDVRKYISDTNNTILSGKCCENGNFYEVHDCMKEEQLSYPDPIADWLWRSGLFDDKLGDELLDIISRVHDEAYRDGLIEGAKIGQLGINITKPDEQ